MSAYPNRPNSGRILLWVAAYAAAYLAASGADLGTTVLAIRQPGAAEANVFATSAGAYDGAKAWFTTGLAGLALVAMVGRGLATAGRVSPEWLRRPMRAFVARPLDLLLWNPWSRRLADRLPLHAVSFGLAFLILRLLAAGNNLMIVAGRAGPFGVAVRAVGQATTPALGLMLVMGATYLALTVAVAPVSAKILGSLRAVREPRTS